MSEPLFASAHLNKEDRKGIAAAAKYNPHLWSADELRAIFVARQKELAAILQALRNAPQHTAPQHLLITGQRGMGKSTLLQRVALGVEEDPELAKSWIALRFPEEQYTVTTPAELWVNVMGALADALERQDLPTLEIDADIARLTALPPAQREAAALTWLKQWCDTHKRRLLMLMDSTDLLFANLAGADNKKSQALQDGGASALWRVRKELLHSPHMLWLGGSYQPLEVSGLYSDAFLDFFQLIELRPLSLVEMQTAIEAMARIFGAGRELKGEEAVAELKRLFAARPERLRAMRQLTGGIPRTTVMLYELFAAGGQDSVRADLNRLLDAITPLYKARLEVLADQPRKVLAHVMESWAPITAKDLARASALPVGTVSAQLTRLEQEGLVEKTAMRGTKRLGFQVSERFFNIWYLMRNAPRGARARVGWLVEFMRLWYSRDELQGLARVRFNAHQGGQLCDGSEFEFSRAIARCMEKNEPDRLQLDWEIFQNIRGKSSFNELFDLQGDDADYWTADQYLVRLSVLDKELMLAPLPEAERLVWLHEVRSALHLTLEEKEIWAKKGKTATTEELIEVRKKLSDVKKWEHLQYGASAIRQLEVATANGEFFPDCPSADMALRQMLRLFSAVPAAFAVALEYLISRRSDPAVEEACNKAIALSPKNARPLNLLGQLLHQQRGRSNEAKNAYENSIKLNPAWATPRVNLGVLLKDSLGRVEESKLAFQKAIELSPQWVVPKLMLGELLSHYPQSYKEAEALLDEAIKLHPRGAIPRIYLGNLLLDGFKRYEEAEAAYRAALQFEPNEPLGFCNLARLLAILNRNEEASSAYRQTLALVSDKDLHLQLQANCWLGNNDLAMLALDSLTEIAAKGVPDAFYQLKEQCFECHAIGLNEFLVKLMEQSRYADFLQPFALALRAASGEGDALLEAPVEVRSMAEEVLRQIKGAG